MVILAETPNNKPYLLNSVMTSLDTTDDEWEMTVYYQSPSELWFTGAVVATIIGSLLLASMAFVIMIQKQNIHQIKKQYMEDLAHPQKLRLRQFLEDTQGVDSKVDDEERILKAKPIAELFPSTTILYAGKLRIVAHRRAYHFYNLY
jgi:hypothetical protein